MPERVENGKEKNKSDPTEDQTYRGINSHWSISDSINMPQTLLLSHYLWGRQDFNAN